MNEGKQEKKLSENI